MPQNSKRKTNPTIKKDTNKWPDFLEVTALRRRTPVFGTFNTVLVKIKSEKRRMMGSPVEYIERGKDHSHPTLAGKPALFPMTSFVCCGFI
jgi:hypothetical protein